MQVYDRLTAAGIPCNLLTGQEVRETHGASHISCTVEMAAKTTGEHPSQAYDVSTGAGMGRFVSGASMHVCPAPFLRCLYSKLAQYYIEYACACQHVTTVQMC
jgi:hypothetical protein